MSRNSRAVLFLAAAVGLGSASVGRAVPMPKDCKPADPASFGVQLRSAGFVRKGDSVDVFVKENGAEGSNRERLILSRIVVFAVEKECAVESGGKRFFVLLAVTDRERETMLAASKRGEISLSAYDPLFDAELLVPTAGETFIPILLGD